MEQYTQKELNNIKNIATQKQMNLLTNINLICEAKFTGSTKDELYTFIGEWMPRMKLLQSLDAAISIPVFHAKKEYNSVHGEWTEEHDSRNPIADEKLKTHILRKNVNHIDALTEYMEDLEKYSM